MFHSPRKPKASVWSPKDVSRLTERADECAAICIENGKASSKDQLERRGRPSRVNASLTALRFRLSMERCGRAMAFISGHEQNELVSCQAAPQAGAMASGSLPTSCSVVVECDSAGAHLPPSMGGGIHPDVGPDHRCQPGHRTEAAQHRRREEGDQAGRRLEEWKTNPAKLREKDRDTRRTLVFGQVRLREDGTGTPTSPSRSAGSLAPASAAMASFANGASPMPAGMATGCCGAACSMAPTPARLSLLRQ